MDTEKFLLFLQTFDRIVKNIKRIEMGYMKDFGLRSVHTGCILYMDGKDDGVTVTQLAKESDSDKALISRAIKELCVGGFIQEIDGSCKNYNKRYILSDRGREVIGGLKTVISKYVIRARENIDPDDMKIFYSVLSEFERNIAQITK